MGAELVACAGAWEGLFPYGKVLLGFHLPAQGGLGVWEFKFCVQDLTHLRGDSVSWLDITGYVPVLGRRGGLG